MYKHYKHYIDYLVLLNPQPFKFNGITEQEWKKMSSYKMLY